jgi:hypothetical protein
MTKRFKVAAWLLCADIKLSTEVSIIVTQDNRPTEAYARELIEAEADEILASLGAVDSSFELSEVSVNGPLSEKKLVLVGSLSYTRVKEQFAALWPKLNLGLFLPDRNFYQTGSDPSASLLKESDPLHIFRTGSEDTVFTIDGDMLAGDIGALFDRSFWLQAWVTFGDRGPRIPPELSLDAANDAQ